MWPIVLAALAIAFPIVGYAVPEWLKSGYIEEADATCSRATPELQALGKEPWQGDPGVHREWMKKRSFIVLATLEAWRQVDVPAFVDSEIKDTYHTAHSAGRHLRVAVDWADAGNLREADDSLDKFESGQGEAVRKARALGLEVCPAGF